MRSKIFIGEPEIKDRRVKSMLNIRDTRKKAEKAVLTGRNKKLTKR